MPAMLAPDRGLSLGPFLFPADVVVLVLAVAAATLAGGALRRRGHLAADGPLWWVLLAALLVSRVAFVLAHHAQYAGAPWSALDIRDRGFDRWTGLVVFVAGTLWLFWHRPPMRTTLAVTAGAGLATWLVATVALMQLAAATRRPLPALTLHDLQGRPVPLQHLVGRPLVINLWATWCGPCRREMPVLVRAQQRDRGVTFAFVDQGEAPDTIRAFLQRLPARPSHLLLDDGRDLARHFDVRGYPTTLFVDSQGRVRDIHVGVLSPATLADALQRIRPPAPSTPGETQ